MAELALETATAAQESGIRGALGAHPRGTYFYDIVDYTTALERDGTDDATTAVQTALDAIQTAMLANNGGRYVLWLGDAILKITGALQTTNGNNAQLILPAIDAIDDHQCTLVIRGAEPVYSVFSVIGTIPTPTKGAIIRSTLATGGGTSPAVISGKPPTGSTWSFTAVNLVIENVVFQTVANPLISCINAEFVHCLDMRDCGISAGQIQSVADATFPTTATSTAIIGPGINNAAISKFKNVWVLGFYVGFRLNEHTTGEIYPFGCVVGLDCTQANHASTLDRLDVHWCVNPIRATGGASRWVINTMNIEHANTGSFVTTADVNDSNNYLEGKVNYASVLAGTGPETAFSKTGGTKFECTAIGDNRTPVWAALSGTTPALAFTNTPKIGTLTLTGNTTFTASGYAQGREYTLYLTGATSTRTLAFPDWTWGGTEPADIASTETMQIKLVCTGSTEQSVFATSIEGTTALSSGFTITDTFTRSDSATTVGTSSSGHASTAQFGTWGIASNKCYVAEGFDTSTNNNIITWDNGSADATVEADITTPSSGGFGLGLTLRYTDMSNHLLVQFTEAGDLILFKRIAGTYTNVANVAAQGYTNSVTYNIKAVMSGTSIEVFVDDVSKITYNTTTGQEAATKHGLNYYHGGGTSPGGRFDNLSITTP